MSVSLGKRKEVLKMKTRLQKSVMQSLFCFFLLGWGGGVSFSDHH